MTTQTKPEFILETDKLFVEGLKKIISLTKENDEVELDGVRFTRTEHGLRLAD